MSRRHPLLNSEPDLNAEDRELDAQGDDGPGPVFSDISELARIIAKLLVEAVNVGEENSCLQSALIAGAESAARQIGFIADRGSEAYGVAPGMSADERLLSPVACLAISRALQRRQRG